MTESSPRARPPLTLVSVDNDADGTGFHGPIPIEPVITVAQLAAHLGVSIQAIYDLRHKRRGPKGFKVGRHLHFRLSEVDMWLKKLESQDHMDTVGSGAQEES